MPSDWAIRRNSLSAGTVLTLLTASFSGRNRMSGGTKATITAVCPDFQQLDGPGAVGHAQLLVNGSGITAPGPGTNDQRVAFPGEQRLQRLAALRSLPAMLLASPARVSHQQTSPLRPPRPTHRAAGVISYPSAWPPRASDCREFQGSAPHRHGRQCRPASAIQPACSPGTSTTAIFRAERAAW